MVTTIWKLHCYTCKSQQLYSFLACPSIWNENKQWGWLCVGLFKHQFSPIKNNVLVWNFSDTILNPRYTLLVLYTRSYSPLPRAINQKKRWMHRILKMVWGLCFFAERLSSSAHFGPSRSWGCRIPSIAHSRPIGAGTMEGQCIQGSIVAFWIPGDIIGCHHSLWITEKGIRSIKCAYTHLRLHKL